MPSTQTVYELPSALIDNAAPLFAEAQVDRPFVDAVMEGRQPARIFVDGVEHPAAALMCRTYDYYVAGDPESMALRRFIADAPAEAGVFAELYGYVPLSTEWVDALLADHPCLLHVYARVAFEWPAERSSDAPGLRAELPGGATLQRIDRALAERIDREWQQRIGQYWGGYEAFLAGGFGFCITVGQELASVAYTAAVSSRYADIDVETARSYRQRGLATAVCAAFIDHCLGRGLSPVWYADVYNHASAGLARKLGFRESYRYTELGLPERGSLPLSRGLWSARPSEAWAGVTVWERRQG